MSLPGSRYDAYAFIHKGLRAFMAHTLVRVGRLDAHDAAEVAEVGDELEALISICRNHLQHENEIVHPAMQSRAPGSCASISAEHEGHVMALDALQQLREQLGSDPGVAPVLYRALGQFVAENFEHMQREETEHNAVLWAHFSDDELHALERRIVNSIPPDEMRLGLRWMLPHLTPAERVEMLSGMRQGAPAEVFEGVLSMIRPLLGGRDWRKLSLALGL